ncbi:MAG: hypothetical protein R3324_14685, partial [Halobacteriales archaeon]|nr:hypothetical protein [Halobacteriales archaeon]
EHVSTDEPLLLAGDDVLVIEDTRYEQRADIRLRGNATLIVRDSRFVHTGPGAAGVTLEADENASVVFERSVLETSSWVPWVFRGSSTARYRHSEVRSGLPWQSFYDETTLELVETGFGGSIYDNATFDIRDSPDVMVELYVSAGQTVDEAGLTPGYVDEYTFPNDGEAGVGYAVHIEDSTVRKWGVGVRPEGILTLRDARGVNICLPIHDPYVDETIRFNGLVRETVFEEKTISYLGTRVALVNTSASGWCIPVDDRNAVSIHDSDIDDIQYSRTTAPLYYENVTARVVIADHGVQLTIVDSTIDGDVVARGDATVVLVDTEVGGEVREQGGTILVR